MAPDMMDVFGWMIFLLSGDLRMISSTTPAWPPASMKSPILNGRNKMMSTPEAKFERAPPRARPTARPAAPRMATREVV